MLVEYAKTVSEKLKTPNNKPLSILNKTDTALTQTPLVKRLCTFSLSFIISIVSCDGRPSGFFNQAYLNGDRLKGAESTHWR